MNNLALYRKYRPNTFDEVYGQKEIVQTLKNQVISNKISHSYLFYGSRGTGKTSMARILAKAINCENPVNGNPCCNCKYCNYKNDINPDIIEIDAASNNGVESIRQLIDEAKYKPNYFKYKVYIIDEVHMLTNSSFNALLKILEEPPEHDIFVLATTEISKVLNTIKSRCQIYNFKFINNNDIFNCLSDIALKENINIGQDILKYITLKSEGSLRDGVSILDQCISQFSNDINNFNLINVKKMFGDIEYDIVLQLKQLIESYNISDSIKLIREQYNNGASMLGITKILYQVYMYEIIQGNSDNRHQRYVRILAELEAKLSKTTNSIADTEISIIKMCKPEMENDIDSIIQRLDILENNNKVNYNNYDKVIIY